MEYHVSKNGNDNNTGTTECPFLTISRAAGLALPGDTVVIHAGVYREWVSPANGGTKEQPIVYRYAGDGEVVITGAEPASDWVMDKNQVWVTEVDNSLFTLRNPFREELFGDWLFKGRFVPHLGEVYLNGKSLYEAASLDELYAPEMSTTAKYKEDSLLLWYAEAGDKTTKIWANFGSCDPRTENVEISVRPYCFWPEKTGRDYITVKGLTMCQASPQWAPPTALQEGLIGPHWSKGWVIEDNIIRESKCVGISLGKDIATGDNEWSHDPIKGGTQREQEVIFRALRSGWSKENIGGHIVRNNVIHDCEQAGIVGHLGGAFCTITQNRIYNIHHKGIFHGAEVSGIKLHAALDTEISENIIYSCYRGIWLDWQAQGTRMSRNVFFDNASEDLFIEVCHGPYLADHNLFLSRMNFRNMAQGGAFVHNLFAGRILPQGEMYRSTPYHFPHQTAVMGYANIIGGDDRFYNNIFLRDDDPENEVRLMTFFEHLPLETKDDKSRTQAMDGVPENAICRLYPVGLGAYDRYPRKFEKHEWEFTEEERQARKEKYGSIYPLGRWALPVRTKGNVYLKDAVPGADQQDAAVYKESVIEIDIPQEKDTVHVRITAPELLRAATSDAVSTGVLGKTYQAEMNYENPDGTAIAFDTDFFGMRRDPQKVVAGPFEMIGGQSKGRFLDVKID